MPHIPDIDAMNGLENAEIRIYALIGAVIILSSSLELIVYNAYQIGSGLASEQTFNSREFHERNLTDRIAAADVVMRRGLSATSDVSEWGELHKRLEVVMGRDAGGSVILYGKKQRDLAGHGEMSVGVTVYPGVGSVIVDLSRALIQAPSTDRGRDTEYQFSVRRGQPHLTRVPAQGPDADATALHHQAQDIIDLIGKLTGFLEHVSWRGR